MELMRRLEYPTRANRSSANISLREPHSLEAIHCCQGAPRRTSEAAMMRLYHSVLLVVFRVLSLVLGI